MNSFWPVPYFLDPRHFAIDAITSFCVSILVTIIITAEAQAFAATFMGDARTGESRRFSFNFMLHLDLLGSLCYLVGGFGWPRGVEVDRTKFRHPRVYMVLTRLSGPVANLLLAGIGGSIAGIMKSLDYSSGVFPMLVGVNVTTAVYNLIILPPMVGGVLVQELLPPGWTGIRQILGQAGPFLLLAVALLERLLPHGLVGSFLNPLVLSVYHFILA